MNEVQSLSMYLIGLTFSDADGRGSGIRDVLRPLVPRAKHVYSKLQKHVWCLFSSFGELPGFIYDVEGVDH